MSTIKINIVSSSEEIYSGEATMVFATGTLGELGIAPGHTPLLTGLAPGPVRVQNGSEEEAFFCSGDCSGDCSSHNAARFATPVAFLATGSSTSLRPSHL